MQVVAQLRLDRLHRRHEATLLSLQLLARHDAVGERARERFELRDLFLNRGVFRFVVEPTDPSHVCSPCKTTSRSRRVIHKTDETTKATKKLNSFSYVSCFRGFRGDLRRASKFSHNLLQRGEPRLQLRATAILRHLLEDRRRQKLSVGALEDCGGLLQLSLEALRRGNELRDG